MDQAVARRPLWDLVWLPKVSQPPNTYISIPTHTTLKVWDTYLTSVGLAKYPSPYTPIPHNPTFTPALEGKSFDSWKEGGCHILADMYDITGPKPFTY